MVGTRGRGPRDEGNRRQATTEAAKQVLEEENEEGRGASSGGAVAAAQQQIARPVTAVQSIVVVQNKYTQTNVGTHTPNTQTHTH